MANTIALAVIGVFMLVGCYGAYLMAMDSDERKQRKLDKDQ